jgi:hypothetical protein
VAEDPCTATGVVWNRPVGTPDGVTDRPPSLMAEASRRIQASPAPNPAASARARRETPSVTAACSTSQAGHAALPQLLRRKVTAIVAFKDLVALGASVRMRELKREVPTALSVVGGDDIPVAAFLGPPLTTIPPPVLTLT